MSDIDIQNWEQQYRARYQGAKGWTQEAIDSQVAFISQLLQEKEDQILMHLNMLRAAANVNEEYRSMRNIEKLIAQYSPPEGSNN